MANPRDSLSYEGLFREDVTCKIDDSTITYSATESNGSAQVGLAVTISNTGDDEDITVQLVGDGEFVFGKLIKVDKDGYCSVQVGGSVKLPAGTGASVTIGKRIVGDLLVTAKGYIREVDTATAAELGVARGYISANGETTEILVWL